jgi:hypothetical protein
MNGYLLSIHDLLFLPAHQLWKLGWAKAYVQTPLVGDLIAGKVQGRCVGEGRLVEIVLDDIDIICHPSAAGCDRSWTAVVNRDHAGLPLAIAATKFLLSILIGATFADQFLPSFG